MSVVEISDKRIVIDGQPQLLISGEIHYFRLDREDWEDRLLKLKAAGGNTVASYIPWLCHEPEQGHFDLDGHKRDALDLAAFIDLVAEHDLWFIARPGPFIMAEMKNEGVPYYLYEEYPEIVPLGWDGKQAPTRTLDYLAPNFLAACRTWYSQVIPLIAQRQIQHGGNVIGLQLDNEVGMLSWVSNSPDLTDLVLDDFRSWLDNVDASVATRLNLSKEALRAPAESISGELMHQLGRYMRYRFAKYIAELRRYAEEFGISGIPCIVNIHGTEAGGGASFPIGISQLYESYTQDTGYLSGSDHYLGDLTSLNAPDLYLLNAYMDAVNRPEQPLTSMEFEAGEGDYGQNRGARLDPSAADFKLRMSVAQGNRLINYYLFTGGINYRLDRETGDGNDRISFTGERHGTNAPISPEGEINFTLPRLARTNKMLASLAQHVSTATEEYDNIAVGFIPDYYLTESIYRGNPVMQEIADDLRRNRFGGPGLGTVRAMMHLNLRYTALNIQDQSIDPASTPVLAVASASYMAPALQQKLVDYLHAGGKLFLHGAVPRFDLTGAPCTTLLDALGLEWIAQRWATHRYFLSGNVEGWLAPRAELRLGQAQTFKPLASGNLIRVYGVDEACGFDIPVGQGRAVVITAEIPTDVVLYQRIFDQLGVVPGLQHDHPLDGIFLTSAVIPEGARFVHALNLDGVDKPVRLTLNGQPLCEGRTVCLGRRDGVMLPFNLDLGEVTVVWSTAEILRHRPGELTLRLTSPEDALLLRTERQVLSSNNYEVIPRSDGVLVRSRLTGHGEETLPIRWR